MPQSCEFGLCKSKSNQMSEGEAKMGAAVEVWLGLLFFKKSLPPNSDSTPPPGSPGQINAPPPFLPIPTTQRAPEGTAGVFPDLWPFYLFLLIFKNTLKKKKGTVTLLVPGGLAGISAPASAPCTWGPPSTVQAPKFG